MPHGKTSVLMMTMSILDDMYKTGTHIIGEVYMLFVKTIMQDYSIYFISQFVYRCISAKFVPRLAQLPEALLLLCLDKWSLQGAAQNANNNQRRPHPSLVSWPVMGKEYLRLESCGRETVFTVGKNCQTCRNTKSKTLAIVLIKPVFFCTVL